MKYIRPKKWEEFQHYKERTPPWIKLHKALLDDYDFQCLPLASRALAPMLWLLASEYEDGRLPADTRKIAFRLRINLQDLSDAFEPLIKAGFFEVIGDEEQADSGTLAERKQDACLETQEVDTRKEAEAETEQSSCSGEHAAPQNELSEPIGKLPEPDIPGFLDRRKAKTSLNGNAGNFAEFYDAYPLHKARRAAEKAYVSALKRATPSSILEGARRYRDDPKRDPEKTKHPATWLNADCWLDEQATGPPSANPEGDAIIKRLQELTNGSQT